jgi:vacuolar-type H+-ATPase subunit D/Vma8
MTREEELLEHIEEQKKYIKLLEEQNEALQKKTGDAVKELDQFRQNEQKKLDDALNDLDELPMKQPYTMKQPYNKPMKTLTDQELLDQLNAIDFDEKSV